MKFYCLKHTLKVLHGVSFFLIAVIPLIIITELGVCPNYHQSLLKFYNERKQFTSINPLLVSVFIVVLNNSGYKKKMDVKQGLCWRCESRLNTEDVPSCQCCKKAVYCSSKCMERDKARHTSVECKMWGQKECAVCHSVGEKKPVREKRWVRTESSHLISLLFSIKRK